MALYIDVATRIIASVALTMALGLIEHATAQAPNRALEATYWKAIELAGTPTPPQDAKREAHLVFQTGRVSGSNGCNRVTSNRSYRPSRRPPRI
jgi:heat shock protein HslJ